MRVARSEWTAIACLAVMVGMLGGHARPAAARCAPVPGDLNGDGFTQISDVQCAILTTLWQQGGTGSPPSCLAGADVNLEGGDVSLADADCSGSPNVADVLIIIRLALGEPLDVTLDADGDQCADACAGPIELEPNWAFTPAGAAEIQTKNYRLRGSMGSWVRRSSATDGVFTLTVGSSP